MFAAQNCHFDVVKYLVEHGADKNKQGKHKQTALMFASAKDHFKVVEYLVKINAKLDEKNF